MDYRPFRFVGSSDRTAIENALVPRIKEWGMAWLNEEIVTPVAIRDEIGARLDALADWFILGDAPDKWVAWEINRALSPDFASVLLATELEQGAPLTPLVEAVCQDCLSDLVQRCFSLANIETTPRQLPKEALLHHGFGSGAVTLLLQGQRWKQRLILSGAVVDGLVLPHRAVLPVAGEALTPRQSAIGNTKAAVELSLGEAELSLAEIVGMRVGDVIALNLHHSEPLTVATTGGKHLFRGHLGRQADNKAIQAISL